jgi:succinate dehydrogenase / fumarate reductase cytochrome b subunit
MLVSILHRVTGDGMAFVALPVLLWWLGALASGRAAYETFTGIATAWYGYVVLVGISWAFFNHLCSGIRHFVLDIGAGYAVDANNRWSVATTAAGVVLTAAFWAVLVLL